MEEYSAKSAVRGASNGTISAIMAVILKQGNSPDFADYDIGASAFLKKMSNGEDEVYLALPGLREKLQQNALKADDLYPAPEALQPLREILLLLV
ncbi:MAG: hypothetical protein NT016_00105 [Candidatus Aenigmarchaeota archaeon]|nr:hypothetical protein [Candidatus Aenigmarchaeota archaeon]